MGRRTFESLPDGALPNRKNLVLTSIPESFYDNAFACSSIEDALNLCESQDEVFIIGGAMIYKQTIEMADKLYITEIHHKFENADTFFPVIDPNKWKEVFREDHPSDEKHSYPYSFVIYEKK